MFKCIRNANKSELRRQLSYRVRKNNVLRLMNKCIL